MLRASLLARGFSAQWPARSAPIVAVQLEITDPARFRTHAANQRVLRLINLRVAIPHTSTLKNAVKQIRTCEQRIGGGYGPGYPNCHPCPVLDTECSPDGPRRIGTLPGSRVQLAPKRMPDPSWTKLPLLPSLSWDRMLAGDSLPQLGATAPHRSRNSPGRRPRAPTRRRRMCPSAVFQNEIK